MLPDRVSNPGPLTYESGALPIALRGPAADTQCARKTTQYSILFIIKSTDLFYLSLKHLQTCADPLQSFIFHLLLYETRIPRNAVSRLPALFHKIEVNL